MVRPTARVLTLLELLQSSGIRTKAELADRLGVDERTVRRYLDHLSELGVPVEAVRGRYGGYRLRPGYRLPPLVLSDDEALAVLLGLIAGRRAGVLPVADTAAETATAKIRRVLPGHLAQRLDALLGTLAFTGEARPASAPDSAILLTLATAVRAHQPAAIRYTDRHGKPSARTVHPYGVVVHGTRWYLVALDPELGDDRLFRLDRIAGARVLPGTFEPPAEFDAAQRVLAGLARTPYQHEVVLQIQGTAEQIRARLPAGLAAIEAAGEGGWLRVDLRVEDLGWLPGVLAGLDRPFRIERPDELRTRVAALAERLGACAHADP